MLLLESRTVPDTQRLFLPTATVLGWMEQRDEVGTFLLPSLLPPQPQGRPLPTSRPPFCLYCRKALVVPLFANRILAKRTFYRERKRQRVRWVDTRVDWLGVWGAGGARREEAVTCCARRLSARWFWW